MKYCIKCGEPLEDNELFCHKCGADTAEETQGQEVGKVFCRKCGMQLAPYMKYCRSCGYGKEDSDNDRSEYTNKANVYSAPISKTKILSVVTYLGVVGFIIAFMLGDRYEPYFRKHLNQSVVLEFLRVIVGILVRHFPNYGFLHIVSYIFVLPLFVAAAFGIVTVLLDLDKEMPVIGKIKIFK